MRTIIILTAFLLLTGISYAEDTTGKIKSYTATVDENGVQRVEMVGGDYYFDPSYIIVKKDIPVELIVKKVPGIVPHNIVIESPEAGMSVRESIGTDAKVIRFTPVKTGKYPVYCDKKFLFFPDHRKKGMEGTIEVVE